MVDGGLPPIPSIPPGPEPWGKPPVGVPTGVPVGVSCGVIGLLVGVSWGVPGWDDVIGPRGDIWGVNGCGDSVVCGEGKPGYAGGAPCGDGPRIGDCIGIWP